MSVSMSLLGSDSRSEKGSEKSSAPEMNVATQMAVQITKEMSQTR